MESACCGIPQSRLRRASSLWQGSLAGSARSQFRTPECLRCQFRSVADAGRHCPSKARYRYCGGGWVVDNHQQVPPPKQTGTSPPAGSLSHGCAVPAPSRRELFLLAFAFPHGCLLRKSAYCNPSDKNQRFLPAPFSKGAFGLSLLCTLIISLSKHQLSIHGLPPTSPLSKYKICTNPI